MVIPLLANQDLTPMLCVASLLSLEPQLNYTGLLSERCLPPPERSDFHNGYRSVVYRMQCNYSVADPDENLTVALHSNFGRGGCGGVVGVGAWLV